MNYATFWQRFAAGWIDFFVVLPVIITQFWLDSISKTFAIVFLVPLTAAYCAYTIVGHGRFGQTVGKYVMRIRVVRTNGERIGWREAWLRSSVEVSFSVLAVISMLIALAAIPDAGYYKVGWAQRMENLGNLQPACLRWVGIANQIWIWSEAIVMLSNRRRRALHDFIAGTVVTDLHEIFDAPRPLAGPGVDIRAISSRLQRGATQIVQYIRKEY